MNMQSLAVRGRRLAVLATVALVTTLPGASAWLAPAAPDSDPIVIALPSNADPTAANLTFALTPSAVDGAGWIVHAPLSDLRLAPDAASGDVTFIIAEPALHGGNVVVLAPQAAMRFVNVAVEPSSEAAYTFRVLPEHTAVAAMRVTSFEGVPAGATNLTFSYADVVRADEAAPIEWSFTEVPAPRAE